MVRLPPCATVCAGDSGVGRSLIVSLRGLPLFGARNDLLNHDCPRILALSDKAKPPVPLFAVCQEGSSVLHTAGVDNKPVQISSGWTASHVTCLGVVRAPRRERSQLHRLRSDSIGSGCLGTLRLCTSRLHIAGVQWLISHRSSLRGFRGAPCGCEVWQRHVWKCLLCMASHSLI
jgi:hypothetical protein